jgi:uncharacterized protein YggT (Ycf19 family)
MTYQERHTTEVTRPLDPGYADAVRTDVVQERRVVTTTPTAPTLAARIVTAIFTVIQVVIGLRIALLLVDAREGNALVAAILALSEPLVAPFEGVLRTNALGAGGAVLDVAAIVALIGWTLLELVILAVLRVGRAGDAV